MKRPPFIPVLLGLDLNAYSMAVSFYETFGITSEAFGRYACGITEHSRLLRTHVIPDLTLDAAGVAALLSFSERKIDTPLLLVPCADWYVSFVERNRDRLQDRFFFCIPPKDVHAAVTDKASFYSLLSSHGIPYPRSLVFRDPASLAKEYRLHPIPFPAILKAADSVAFAAVVMEGKEKVYYPNTLADVVNVVQAARRAGYTENWILQQKIEKAGGAQKTLTVLADRHSLVRATVLGRIVLEEIAPGARGNYAAILTEACDSLSRKLAQFTQDIGYVGIGNFDILYDADGNGYVLEMNARQGRSCDYLRAASVSLAAFLYAQSFGLPYEGRWRYPLVYWRAVSDATVRKYATNVEAQKEAMRRKEEGYAFSPFAYEAEHCPTLWRRLYFAVHAHRRDRAFSKYQNAVNVK